MIRWQTFSQRNSEFKSFFIVNRDESFACRVRHSWIDLLIIACFDHKSITVVSDWEVFSDKLLGLNGPCGLGVSGETDFDEAMDSFWQMHERLQAECEVTLQQTMSEGEAQAAEAECYPPEPPDGPEPEPKVVKTEEKPYADRTEVITWYADGTVKVKTVRTTNDDQTQVTAVTTEPNGTVTTTVDLFGSDGKQLSGTSKTLFPNGRIVRTWTRYKPDGSYSRTVWGVDKNGKFRYIDYGVDANGAFIGGQTCVGESCGSCADYDAMYLDLISECATSGGASFMCQRVTNQVDCCGNPDAVVGDPRIVMPDPQGDLMCVGGETADVKEERCNVICNVAYHEDCVSQCMSLQGLDFDVDLMGFICPMAISDDCFSSSAPIVVPRGLEDKGPSPLPEPILHGTVLDHFVYPIEDRIAPGIPGNH
jgi:hypothetical protein